MMTVAPLALWFASMSPASSVQDAWAVGQPLPALRLPTIDGAQTIDLADLRGRKLLLVQFASW